MIILLLNALSFTVCLRLLTVNTQSTRVAVGIPVYGQSHQHSCESRNRHKERIAEAKTVGIMDVLVKITTLGLVVAALLYSLQEACCATHTHRNPTRKHFHNTPRDTQPTQRIVSWTDCLSNVTACAVSDTVVVLSPHNNSAPKRQFENSTKYIFQNLENFKITSGSNGVATTTCDKHVSFAFMNVTNLTIFGVNFVNCGSEIPTSFKDTWRNTTLSFFTLNNLSATLLFLNSVNLDINKVTVNNSLGLGILAINVLGKTILQDSRFQRDSWVNTTSNRYGNSQEGVAFLFTDPADSTPQCQMSITNYLEISMSVFTNGNSTSGDHDDPNKDLSEIPRTLTLGAGLSIIQAQSSYAVFIALTKVTSLRNHAAFGANLLIITYRTVRQSSIIIQDSIFNSGNIFSDVRLDNITGEGGGMFYAYGFLVPEDFDMCNQQSQNTMAVDLAITDSLFQGNVIERGAGAYLDIYSTQTLICCHNITVSNCTFGNNIATIGSALMINKDAHVGVTKDIPYIISISGSSFYDNIHLQSLSEHSFHFQELDGSAIVLGDIQLIDFCNCNITRNEVIGIFAVSSIMSFTGRNVLSYNSGGRYGGAIAMYLGSLLFLLPGSKLEIVGNRARQIGGGIYVSSSTISNLSPVCFYQLPYNLTKVTPLDKIDSIVYMRNNTAKVTGGSVYGGNLDSCIQSFVDANATKTFQRVFDTDVDLSNSTQTGISSDPLGPCFCGVDQTADCSIEYLNRRVFSGEEFNVSVVGVGQFDGPVPSVIINELYADNQYYTIVNPNDTLPHQHSSHVDASCTNITLHVHAKQRAVILLYTYNSFTIRYFTKNVYVDVSACPLGFVLQEQLFPMCHCIPKYTQHCNIADGTISRSGTIWIGYASGSPLLHKYCPYDYCRTQRIKLKLNESDQQCAFHRQGILCGKCEEGLSLTFGTSQCRKCSNMYLTLLVPFAIAGLLLVFILCVCNITAAAGTVNGFIFYANVVRINSTTFFPTDHVTDPLSIIIAWVNLDLGIETCFYDQMDGYGKTWLQYAFPLYIWAIVCMAIIAGRHSILQKAITSNVVPVLATLFVLSYAKLQRTIITSLSCTWLDYDNHRSLVWLYDGNIACFEGKHLYLAIVAMAVMILFILPFMVVLLFARQLQAHSTHVLLTWVNKLKPLLDAYQGPYKDKYRYWPGFMFLVQNVLFLSFAVNVEGSPTINCMIIVITVTVLLWVWIQTKGVYQKWPKNILESFFLANLGILAAASLYVRVQEQNITTKQEVTSSVLVGTAFVAFLLVVAYHVFQRVNSVPTVQKYLKAAGKKLRVWLSSRLPEPSSHWKETGDSTKSEEGGNRPVFAPYSSELVITNIHATGFESFTATSTLCTRSTVELREPLLESSQT